MYVCFHLSGLSDFGFPLFQEKEAADRRVGDGERDGFHIEHSQLTHLQAVLRTFRNDL